MNKYVFKSYDSVFPELFEKEKKRLSKYLISEFRIEHVGSTAVPGLGGKGIIDIYIVAPKNKLKIVSTELEKAGYEYRQQSSTSGHLFHRIDLPDPIEKIRRYHVHLGYLDSEDFTKATAFRDYLRSHPEDVKLYAEIKKRAAQDANQNKDTYMRIKSPFMQGVLEKALK